MLRTLLMQFYALFLCSDLVLFVLAIEPFQGQVCKRGPSDVILSDVTYVTCVTECNARAWCTGVSHQVAADVCFVHGSDAVPQSTDVCRSWVYSERATWQEQSVTCESSGCDQKKASCSSDLDACLYTDCPAPVQTNTLVLTGNLRSRDARITYHCEAPLLLQGAQLLTCLETGVWDQTFPTCETAATTTPQTVTIWVSTTTAAATTQASTTESTTTTTQASTTDSTTQTSTTESTTTTTQASTTDSTTQASTTESTTTTTQASTTDSTTETSTTTTTTTQTSTTEFTTTTTPTTTTQSAGTTCDGGWTFHDGRCYLINNSYRYFQGAIDYCAGLSSEVVQPNTQAENDFIRSLLSGSYSYWIGLEYDAATLSWYTLDGDSLSYSDWSAGSISTGGQPCVIYINTNGYQWRDNSCLSQFHTICEKPAT